ncbi:MAG: NAD(P)-binding domain-containing protein [Candidatus Delongbacteria bacterium]
MKIGVLGSGVVARTLAAGFLRHGHQVCLGTRDTGKLADLQAAQPGLELGSVSAAAEFGELLVLAVKGTAAVAVLESAGEERLAGKVVLDATNPIADLPPEGGVLRLFTEEGESLLERLQEAFPAVRLVKAFSCVGSALMVNPELPGGPPSMFICGDDLKAKESAGRILAQFGWQSVDMGDVRGARAIEPLVMLWCLPGFLRGEWSHAFKLLAS